MSVLAKATKGKLEKPYFVLLYGEPGVGKSWFAKDFPSPIFLVSENGSDELDVTRIRIQSANELVEALKELNGTHDFKTVVLDTVDGFEQMIFDKVASEGKKSSIEDFGYGKGYKLALDVWHEIVGLLEALNDKGLNVVMLAHSKIKAFNDPQLDAPYDMHLIKMHEGAAELLRDKTSTVLFATFKTYLNATDKNSKAKAYGEGLRVMMTEKRPAFLAKNRYGLPFEMPLDFNEFDRAAKNHTPKAKESMIKFIEESLPQLDEKIREKAKENLEKNRDNAQALAAIENRIKTILSTKTA